MRWFTERDIFKKMGFLVRVFVMAWALTGCGSNSFDLPIPLDTPDSGTPIENNASPSARNESIPEWFVIRRYSGTGSSLP